MLQTNLSMKHNHRHREKTGGCQGERGPLERRMEWEFGVSRCRLLYIGWIKKGAIV